MIRGPRAHDPPRRYGAVLFDLDGTLVDSSADLTLALNATLAELGLPARTPAEVRRFVGDGALKLVTRGLPPDRADLAPQALARFTAHYGARLIESTRPYPGVPRCSLIWARCRSRSPPTSPRVSPAPSCRGSGSPEAPCRGRGRLPARAQTRSGSALAVAATLGVDRSAVLVVGDGAQDIEAARGAQMTSCGVLWGYRGADVLLAAGADLLIDAPADLLRVVGFAA